MKPLKRHPTLVGLSREHHSSLSSCVRLLRMPDQSHQTELEPHFVELESHLSGEETMFAPYWNKVDPALRQRFEDDHTKLRAMMVHPEYMNESRNKEFVMALCDHARLEGRELFPAIEPFLSLPENV